MPRDNPRGYHVVVVRVWIKTRKNDYENGGSRINLMLGYFMQSISFIIIYYFWTNMIVLDQFLSWLNRIMIFDLTIQNM